MNRSYPYPFPSELVLHVTQILGDKGREWLNGLGRYISELQEEWSITVERAYEAGEFNFVAPAVRNGFEDVVLKIAPPFEHGEALSEAAFLRHRDGRKCVRLLEQDRERRAMLIERAKPGESFAEHFKGREPESILPAIETLKNPYSPPPADEPEVIHLDEWFRNFERSFDTDFPRKYSEKALNIYMEAAERSEISYLHGDFHPGNIVTATREPFLLIDPKGIVGPVGFDIAVYLNNYHWWQPDHPDLINRLRAAVTAFAAAFGMTEDEVSRWAFAVRVLGAWWTYDEMPGLYSGGVVKADIWENL